MRHPDSSIEASRRFIRPLSSNSLCPGQTLATAHEQRYGRPVDQQRQNRGSRQHQREATGVGQDLLVRDGAVYDVVRGRGGSALCGRPRRGGSSGGSGACGIARRGPRSSAGRTSGSRTGACRSSARSGSTSRPRSGACGRRGRAGRSARGGRGGSSFVVQDSAERNLGYEIVRLIEGSEGTPGGGAEV